MVSSPDDGAGSVHPVRTGVVGLHLVLPGLVMLASSAGVTSLQPLHGLHPVLHGADHHGLGGVSLGPSGRQHHLQLDSCNMRINDGDILKVILRSILVCASVALYVGFCFCFLGSFGVLGFFGFLFLERISSVFLILLI